MFQFADPLFCFIVLVVFRYSDEMRTCCMVSCCCYKGDDEAYDLVHKSVHHASNLRLSDKSRQTSPLLFFLPGNWLEPYGVIHLPAETQVQDLCVFFRGKERHFDQIFVTSSDFVVLWRLLYNYRSFIFEYI